MAKCCQAAAAAEIQNATDCGSLRTRSLSALGWILPAAVLALMPKCPVCVAAYAAAFTGIGLSLTAASYLRSGLIAVAVVGLVAMAAVRLIAVCRSRRLAASR